MRIDNRYIPSGMNIFHSHPKHQKIPYVMAAMIPNTRANCIAIKNMIANKYPRI
jgi:hypothetical protein